MRRYITLPNLQHFIGGEKAVIWYVGTGKQNSDEFFRFGGFYSASKKVWTLLDYFNSSNNSIAEKDQNTANLSATSDELTSIITENFYAGGDTTSNSFDPNTLDPNVVSSLPPGYILYNNLARDAQTEAEASAPFTITFEVPSATNQIDFDKLRILHAEQDPFDPDKAIWVDRTILGTDPQAPDFNSKKIKAKTNRLGPFVVASLVNPPQNIGIADISVGSSHSPTQVVAGNELTFTTIVNNNSSQAATNIKLASSLPIGSRPILTTSSQGTCKDSGGTIVCKIGNLDPGSSINITTVVKTSNQDGQFSSPGGRTISSTTFVRSDENDPNLANNVFTDSATLLPDPNLAPTVKIISPVSGETLASTASITLTAEATDADGNISKVEFFDNGQLIGTVTSPVSNQYVLNLPSASFGDHSIIAVATDNLGKTKLSTAANLFVNGPGKVVITSPSAAIQVKTIATVAISAYAEYGNGSISKVDFYANGVPLGAGTGNGYGNYNFNWSNLTPGVYSVVAVATDNNGVLIKSSPVVVNVYFAPNFLPTVSMLSPEYGTTFFVPTNINLYAEAKDRDGTVSVVNFYANGSPIGACTLDPSNSRCGYTWTNVPIGTYRLTGITTDNEGGVSQTSSESLVYVKPPPPPVLFIASSTTLTTSDEQVRARLSNLGYNVTVKAGTTATAADATGKVLVVISSTVSPTSVGTKFRTVTVPVVTWESALFPNMGMTTTATKDFGTAARQTQLQIINATHPLAGGLTGTVTVYTASDSVNWGVPNANAAKVATVVGASTKIAVFGYSSGASMPGLVAPAKRVGLFMFDTSANHQSNGWNLFDAAIAWATQ